MWNRHHGLEQDISCIATDNEQVLEREQEFLCWLYKLWSIL